MPKADRDEMVTRFPTDDVAAPALFRLSLNASGTGLTLTAANHVVHVDRWWNAAVEDQATDRAFRIGAASRLPGAKVLLHRNDRGDDRRDDRAKGGHAARIVGGGERWLNRAVRRSATRAAPARERFGDR